MDQPLKRSAVWMLSEVRNHIQTDQPIVGIFESLEACHEEIEASGYDIERFKIDQLWFYR